jgi:hypothetical protein
LSLILSLIEPEIPAGTLTATPNAAASTTIVSAVSATSPTTKQKADVATVSRRNFIQVNDLVTEIRFPNSQMNPTAFGTWMDRQARRIDQLPMLDVDPDLLDFSQGVAKSLRISAANQRNAAIRATTTSRDTTRYYADGYSNQPYKVESASRIQGRMEAASANLSHVDIMRMIDDETAAMRRLLTERYRLEF